MLGLSNQLRSLCIDMVEQANSGHPGMPLGVADILTVLYAKHLNFDPKNPKWINRDRLILSAGHGSAVLYAANFLLGYKFSLDDLKNFRQLHSVTPGHPEYDIDYGIECTTGPLGQGIAMAVGMAISQKKLEAEHGSDFSNHKIYTICGDGCLAEGVAQEAVSLAGHLQLDNMILIFDSNEITIDGSTDLSTSEDHIARFKAANWNTFEVDGHNHDDIDAILEVAKKSDKPSFIKANTKIGFSAEAVEGKSKAHGAPLGADLAAETKQKLVGTTEKFFVNKELLQQWRSFAGRSTFDVWNIDHADLEKDLYENKHLNSACELLQNYKEELPKAADRKSKATRSSSGDVVDVISAFKEFVGGSADLTGSVKTKAKSQANFSKQAHDGTYINYGVREHAMGAIANGIALYGIHTPYVGTFLTFSDYMRPSIRLAALMNTQVIYVFTHDSIGLGEDGPTHQAVEHLAALRAIPGLQVLRPCDDVETVECWQQALKYEGPTALLLSRQNLQQLRNANAQNLSADECYNISSGTNASLAVIASGSEVEIAIQVQELLKNDGIECDVLSCPRKTYVDLSKYSNVSVIEAGIRMGWEGLISHPDLFFGVESFGHSAPYKEVYEEFGLLPKQIAEKIKQIVS